MTVVILLIIAELICIGFAALLRRRARQGSDAPHLGIMGVIVALSDFLAAIFAVAIAYNAQVFGAWTGLGVAIIMNLLAGVALAQALQRDHERWQFYKIPPPVAPMTCRCTRVA